MRLSFIPFQIGHLDFIEPKDIYVNWEEMKSRLNSLVYNNSASTKTILCDGRPIAIVGIIILWNGTAEGWTLTSELIRKVPVTFTRLVKELLELAIRSFGLLRVQVSVREDYPEGQRWAEYMGFKKEGLMVNYGPGRINSYLYARTG